MHRSKFVQSSYWLRILCLPGGINPEVSVTLRDLRNNLFYGYCSHSFGQVFHCLKTTIPRKTTIPLYTEKLRR